MLRRRPNQIKGPSERPGGSGIGRLEAEEKQASQEARGGIPALSPWPWEATQTFFTSVSSAVKWGYFFKNPYLALLICKDQQRKWNKYSLKKVKKNAQVSCNDFTAFICHTQWDTYPRGRKKPQSSGVLNSFSVKQMRNGRDIPSQIWLIHG